MRSRIFRGDVLTPSFPKLFLQRADALIAKMKASGAGAYDVVTVNESGLYLGVKQGVFEELRLENIPNYANVVKVLQKPAYDPGPGIHSVPDVFGSSAIVYNTKHVAKPTSWDVLWDPQYKGRIVVRDAAIYRVFITALRLGMNPNNISDIGNLIAPATFNIEIDHP